MKTNKNILYPLAIAVSAFGIFSCETNPKVDPKQDLLPKTLSVDIPSTISNSNFSGRIGGRIDSDTINGNVIYQNLGTFIAVGEASGKIVDAIIGGIRKYHIDRIINLTYRSDDDSRTKNLVVEANVTFEGKLWDYQMTVTDTESHSQPDGGKAMQVFWNNRTPVEGIAILKPYNINRADTKTVGTELYRIDYSEAGTHGYDAEMLVSISGLPLSNTDVFSINTLKMFAGKKGDIVDVYGNSNHPNAHFVTDKTGYDWAFVASGSDPKNMGVAEVGLPASTLNSSERQTLLKVNSIKNVLTSEATAAFPGIDQKLLANYLKSADAPGYFNNKGFISGGVSPGAAWDTYAQRLSSLSPFNPSEVSALQVKFK